MSAERPRDWYKRRLGVDVLTAARQRIATAFDVFDNLVVCYSGGKDSRVCLFLVKEEAERRGRLPVHAVFYDEETINPRVVEFVRQEMALPWLDLRYYCYPLESWAGGLTGGQRYVQWGKGREWVRPKPEWAITPAPGDDRVRSQYEMDGIAIENLPGKVGLIRGIRAQESLLRLRSILQRRSQAWISRDNEGAALRRSTKLQPIYDWEENDVLKYLAESGAGWCSVYEGQSLVGQQLRVATSVNATGIGEEFGKGLLRQRDPEFYARICDLFPGMRLVERYGSEFDRAGVATRVAAGGEQAIRGWISREVEDPVVRRRAYALAEIYCRAHKKAPEVYPLSFLVAKIMAGQVKGDVRPNAAQAALHLSREAKFMLAEAP